MIELPLLDKDCREAFVYPIDEINTVMSCSDNWMKGVDLFV